MRQKAPSPHISPPGAQSLIPYHPHPGPEPAAEETPPQLSWEDPKVQRSYKSYLRSHSTSSRSGEVRPEGTCSSSLSHASGTAGSAHLELARGRGWAPPEPSLAPSLWWTEDLGTDRL